MRTTEQILAEMDGIFASLPAEQQPTTTSEVGFFAMLKNAWALLVQQFEYRFDQLITDVQTALAAQPVGSLAWYVAQAKKFQYGDTVGVYQGTVIGYATIDPAKQIVAQCSVTEDTNGRLLAKVAKKSGTGLVALTDAEQTAFREYMRQVKYAGVVVDVISMAADELRLTALVQYDRQVLGPNGELLTDTSKRPVVDAINAYLRALPFDSVLNWTALTDYLQKQAGIIDFQVRGAAIRPAGSTNWIIFDRETVSRAGHVVLHTDSQLTYV